MLNSFFVSARYIIHLAMQVYVELALIENFCMDFTLLYSAKIVTKNLGSVFRIIFAAVLGACFAVVFPLFGLNGVWAVAVKIISGLIICLFAGKFKGIKAYFKLTAAFLVFTFVLGGALIAVFMLAGIDYSANSGYMLSSVPIGIPMLFALILIIGARKIAWKLKKAGKTTVTLRIWSGEKYADLSGFFDSGNKVYHLGQPVSVIPLATAMKIVDESEVKDYVKVHTVAGNRKIKIFKADKIEIYNADKTGVFKNVLIGISPYAVGGAVLHPDLMEE